jgi:hypothetical protein
VPGAIGLFGHGWNPHYFVNPPGYTYLLHLVFAAWFGGARNTGRTFATDPTSTFTVARVTTAVLGTASVGLLYAAGVRLFDRATGLLAGGVLAVGFLPVFYSHLALDDVPATAAVCLALAAGVIAPHSERPWWWVLAGIGVGVAAATKYTALIVLLPVLGAAVISQRPAGAVLTGGAALAAFFAVNPYAILDLHTFTRDLGTQEGYASGGLGVGKLGLTQDSGIVYYAWTVTWGLGWAPAVAALGGAVHLVARDRARALVLVPAPVVFMLYMGVQDRYFGRWLLPVVPLLALLAAHAAVTLARRAPRAPGPALALAGAVLLGQGVWASVRSDRLLSRATTENDARAWLVANVPTGSRIVVEPVVPMGWMQDPGAPRPRWIPWRFTPPPGQRMLPLEDFERALVPGLLARYRRQGFCWVVIGSTQYERALAEPAQAPGAVAYYRALSHQGIVVHRESPYKPGARPANFNFDWSFDFYPGAYGRPGAEITIYRLKGCHPYPPRAT